MQLAAGVHPARAFSNASRYGWQIANGYEGAGRGEGGTLLRQGDHTSRSAKLVPKRKGQTNPLYVLRTTGSSRVVLSGFTLDGGDQGHLYNGIRIEKTKAPLAHDLRILAVPGDSDVPPGETFGLNLWRAVGPVLHDIEVDGAGLGASGVGWNSCSGGSTTLVTAHDHPHCKAFALWQHAGGHVFDRVQSLNNAFGFGFERCAGSYTIREAKFRGSTRADVHLASDTGRGTFHFIDPDLGSHGSLKVLLPKTEIGRPNLQQREDIRITLAGRDRPDLLHFVSRA